MWRHQADKVVSRGIVVILTYKNVILVNENAERKLVCVFFLYPSLHNCGLTNNPIRRQSAIAAPVSRLKSRLRVNIAGAKTTLHSTSPTKFMTVS